MNDKQKEWQDFFCFIYEVFENSKHCGDDRACKYIDEMFDKIKEMLKKEDIKFPKEDHLEDIE